MRACTVTLLVAACSSPSKPTAMSVPTAAAATEPAAPSASAPAAAPTPPPSAPEAREEKLAADTPRTTTQGNTFIAPAGWSITVRGDATILTAPEGGSSIALVDTRAADADAAVKSAWVAYKGEPRWPVKVANDGPPKDGWTD